MLVFALTNFSHESLLGLGRFATNEEVRHGSAQSAVIYENEFN